MSDVAIIPERRDEHGLDAASAVSVHHLPCKIQADSARVSSYFCPETVPGKGATATTLRATFRGRLLEGHTIALPPGVVGLLLTDVRASSREVSGDGVSAIHSLSATQSTLSRPATAAKKARGYGRKAATSPDSDEEDAGGDGCADEDDDDDDEIIDFGPLDDDEGCEAMEHSADASARPPASTSSSSSALDDERTWRVSASFKNITYWWGTEFFFV